MRVGLLAAAVLAIASPAAAATTAFTDSSFDPFEVYDVRIYAPSTLGGYYGYAAGSDADFAFNSVYIKAVGEPLLSVNPRFQALNTTFVYDPSVQGEITSIDASADIYLSMLYDLQSISSAPPAQIRILAEQGGVTYIAGKTFDELIRYGVFENRSVTGLTETDFRRFNPLDPYSPSTGGGLDFSGGAITFGFEHAHSYLTVNGEPAPGRINSDYRTDKFKIVVNHNDPGAGTAVPEPATWAMMITGFSLVGLVARRRMSVAA